jgi:5-hydroxyisourate hydrolase-like protein (transthyretin family)
VLTGKTIQLNFYEENFFNWEEFAIFALVILKFKSMKSSSRYHFILLLSLISLYTIHTKGVNIDSLLNVLDDAIAHQAQYDGIREARISKIMQRNKMVKGDYVQQYNNNLALADEYKVYKHDSVVKYLNVNLNLALKNKDTYR